MRSKSLALADSGTDAVLLESFQGSVLYLDYLAPAKMSGELGGCTGTEQPVPLGREEEEQLLSLVGILGEPE